MQGNDAVVGKELMKNKGKELRGELERLKKLKSLEESGEISQNFDENIEILRNNNDKLTPDELTEYMTLFNQRLIGKYNKLYQNLENEAQIDFEIYAKKNNFEIFDPKNDSSFEQQNEQTNEQQNEQQNEHKNKLREQFYQSNPKYNYLSQHSRQNGPYISLPEDDSDYGHEQIPLNNPETVISEFKKLFSKSIPTHPQIFNKIISDLEKNSPHFDTTAFKSQHQTSQFNTQADDSLPTCNFPLVNPPNYVIIDSVICYDLDPYDPKNIGLVPKPLVKLTIRPWHCLNSSCETSTSGRSKGTTLEVELMADFDENGINPLASTRCTFLIGIKQFLKTSPSIARPIYQAIPTGGSLKDILHPRGNQNSPLFLSFGSLEYYSPTYHPGNLRFYALSQDQSPSTGSIVFSYKLEVPSGQTVLSHLTNPKFIYSLYNFPIKASNIDGYTCSTSGKSTPDFLIRPLDWVGNTHWNFAANPDADYAALGLDKLNSIVIQCTLPKDALPPYSVAAEIAQELK